LRFTLQEWGIGCSESPLQVTTVRNSGSVVFIQTSVVSLTHSVSYYSTFSGVARICCDDRQSWKVGQGALTAGLQGRVQQLLDDYAALIETAVCC